MRGVEFFEEAPPEEAREHAHGQEEARAAGDPTLAVQCYPAAGDDAVHVRVMRQCRAPAVQHQRRADAGPQVLGIGSDGEQGFGGNVEQQTVDHGLVLIGDGGDRRRQREDYVVVLHRQQIGLSRLEPALCRTGLALRAMAIAAGVVGDLVGPAALTTQYMATQCRAAALLDGRHDLELSEAQVRALRLAPSGPMETEDVGDLQGGAPHGG